MHSFTALRTMACVAALAALSACTTAPETPPSTEASSSSDIKTPVPAASAASATHAPGAASLPASTLNARLYPANTPAAQRGMMEASLANPRASRGIFSLTIDGQRFDGESTFSSATGKGTAKAKGDHGALIDCQYTINRSSLGTGVCALSTGAKYNLHFNV